MRRRLGPSATQRLAHRLTLACLALLPSLAAPAVAQTVTNPRIVEFTPSPDHHATLAGGQAAVNRYDVEVYMTGASAPFHTVDAGKPVPDPDGKVRYDFLNRVSGWPLPGAVYQVRVSAVGPEGVGRSTPSNQFVYDPCYWVLWASSFWVSQGSGEHMLTLPVPSGCAWTASTSTTWISVTTPSGTGSGTLRFTVGVNEDRSSRSGSVTISGQTLTVIQSGVGGPPNTPRNLRITP
jgi:hypothetical protein